jgi:hypothetical protein
MCLFQNQLLMGRVPLFRQLNPRLSLKKKKKRENFSTFFFPKQFHKAMRGFRGKIVPEFPSYTTLRVSVHDHAALVFSEFKAKAALNTAKTVWSILPQH